MSSLPLALLQPRTFVSDARFGAHLSTVHSPAPPQPVAEDETPDPEQLAFARGLEEGRMQAAMEFEARAAEETRRLDALEHVIRRVSGEETAALREMLRQTVLVLCEKSVLPLALDIDGLAARVEMAAAMLVRAQDQKHIRLNPQDCELVRPLVAADLVLEPDPSIERGGLRIDAEDGGVEDGPSAWRAILEEALGEC